MNQVDARGYSCPEPVLMTKKALKNGTPLVVLVDNETPLQNVRRFAMNNGYQVTWKEVGEDYELTITK
ncbi:sulfurtransferase TusA family protein [Pseudoflavonifractor phocaeensis]|uniref:sulfurtransferase TusA family protein n=1 Tax=Pseudoflavonifractor phocaeensis TaxID=1870988 RepID=UPI00195F1AA8|nr:sulfurtransferase TusA family protein [Pseudoflavonifractor phocaeensis]MBM6924927.1 sulfurtransferase TusA family protein [Pseudoflavonifractor phocaeensis]